MSTVKIAASFDKDAPEFPFYQIAEYVKDFDTTYETEEIVTVEYQVYVEYAAFVETVINDNPGTITYTVAGVIGGNVPNLTDKEIDEELRQLADDEPMDDYPETEQEANHL